MSQDVKSSDQHPRLKNEIKTIRAMIGIYCQAHHDQGKELCHDCEQLMEYAEKRVRRCLFQAKKPTCGNCRVHCYKPDMRQKVRNVMRYAGPRMTYKHPLMAIRHLLDSRREAPELAQTTRKRRETS